MGNPENAVIIGRVLAPFLVVVGLWMLIYKNEVRKAIEEVYASAFLTHLAGALNIILGVLILNFYNVWSWTWHVVVTVLGWLMILKGLFFYFVPGPMKKMKVAIAKSEFWLPFFSVVAVLLGVYLSYTLYLA